MKLHVLATMMWLEALTVSCQFSKTDCPPPGSKCDIYGSIFSIENKSGPRCWKRGYNEIYKCKALKFSTNKCPDGYIDIVNCGGESKTSCPTNYYTPCKSSDGNDLIAGKRGEYSCWSKNSDGKYTCEMADRRGKCKENQIDMDTCKIPSPQECPKDYLSKCSSSIGTFDAGNYGTNNCWNKDKSGNYLCQPKDQKTGYCPLGFVDMSYCNFAPSCPTDFFTTCHTKESQTFISGNYQTNKCWSLGKDNQYLCSPANESTGKCKTNEVDVSKCELDRPFAPKCPESPFKSCQSSSGESFSSQPDDNVCWSIKGNGEFFCFPKNKDGQCNSVELDITKCNYPKRKMPCPKSYDDSCFNGNDRFTFKSPESNFCWKKPSNFRTTCGKVGVNGKCTNEELDIRKCQSPVCPSALETCTLDGKSFKLLDSDSPICWGKSKSGGWKCANLDDEFNCPDDTRNIEVFCSRPLLPTCPNELDTCTSSGTPLTFLDTKSPKCWKQGSDGWECFSPPSGTCPEDTKDISTCTKPEEVKCPLYSDQCYGESGVINPLDADSPPCWRSDDFGWSCEPKDDITGQCPESYKEISTCKIEKPSGNPNCPKVEDSCYFEGEIFFTASPDTPRCWKKDNYGWSCEMKISDTCLKGFMDIKEECEASPPPDPVDELPCPKNEDKCNYFGMDIKYSNELAPNCWKKGITAWSCYRSPKETKCKPEYKDISNCKKDDETKPSHPDPIDPVTPGFSDPEPQVPNPLNPEQETNPNNPSELSPSLDPLNPQPMKDDPPSEPEANPGSTPLKPQPDNESSSSNPLSESGANPVLTPSKPQSDNESSSNPLSGVGATPGLTPSKPQPDNESFSPSPSSSSIPSIGSSDLQPSISQPDNTPSQGSPSSGNLSPGQGGINPIQTSIKEPLNPVQISHRPKKPYNPKPKDYNRQPYIPRPGYKKPYIPRKGYKKPYIPRTGYKKPYNKRPYNPTPSLQCPAFYSTCFIGNYQFQAYTPNSPTCWLQDRLNPSLWYCGFAANYKCPPNTVDLLKCITNLRK